MLFFDWSTNSYRIECKNLAGWWTTWSSERKLAHTNLDPLLRLYIIWSVWWWEPIWYSGVTDCHIEAWLSVQSFLRFLTNSPSKLLKLRICSQRSHKACCLFLIFFIFFSLNNNEWCTNQVNELCACLSYTENWRQKTYVPTQSADRTTTCFPFPSVFSSLKTCVLSKTGPCPDHIWMKYEWSSLTETKHAKHA